MNVRYIPKAVMSLCEAVERTLIINLSDVKDLLLKVNFQKKITPQLHALHASLQFAIKDGLVTSTLQCIKSIHVLLKKEQSHAASFSVLTVSSEDWEQKVLRDL